MTNNKKGYLRSTSASKGQTVGGSNTNPKRKGSRNSDDDGGSGSGGKTSPSGRTQGKRKSSSPLRIDTTPPDTRTVSMNDGTTRQVQSPSPNRSNSATPIQQVQTGDGQVPTSEQPSNNRGIYTPASNNDSNTSGVSGNMTQQGNRSVHFGVNENSDHSRQKAPK